MAMTINNVAYSWSMVQLMMNGSNMATSFTGIKGLKWSKKKNIKTNYGLQGKAVSRGFGNTECSASITMDYATVLALKAELSSLTDLGEFTLIVSFANAVDNVTAGGISNTHTITLSGCFFNEDGFESEEDDSNIVKEYDLNPFDITIS